MKRAICVWAICLIVSRTWGRQKREETNSMEASKTHHVLASDLNRRLAKWRRVDMPFNSAGLSERERQENTKLAEARQYLDNIFWPQNEPEGIVLPQFPQRKKKTV